MFFLVHYARVIHALRRFLSRKKVLWRVDDWAKRSRWGLWFRSLFSVLDFHDFITLDTPWWTLRSGRRVRDFLTQTPHPRALEWGSGASTVWLSTFCDEVISIESDANWAASVADSIPAHVTLVTPDIPRRLDRDAVRSKRWGFRHLDFRHYVNAPEAFQGLFDLIVIDGRAREACFEKALGLLASGGMILFDNTNRRRYRRALYRYRNEIVVSHDIGLTPIVPWPTETSIIRLAPSYAASADTGAAATSSR